jgi:hypothetical protein
MCFWAVVTVFIKVYVIMCVIVLSIVIYLLL